MQATPLNSAPPIHGADQPTESTPNASDQSRLAKGRNGAGGAVDCARKLVFCLKKAENTPTAPREESQHNVHPYASLQTRAAIFAHGEKVANVLQEWGAGQTLQVAGLLHSLVWNGLLSSECVAEHCGNDVQFLCQTYRERFAERRSATVGKQGRRWRGRTHILQRIKYLLLAYENFDLAILGAADLWCHFQASRSGQSLDANSNEGNEGLRSHSPRRQVEIVQQVCKPYFEFLGLHELIDEIDRWLFSVQLQNSKNRSQKKRSPKNQDTDSTIDGEAAPVQNMIAGAFGLLLPQAKIRHSLYLHLHNSASASAADATNPSSNFSATTSSDSTVNSSSNAQQAININQAHNIGIVVDTVEQCYQMLGVVHQCFTPVDGAMQDHLCNSRLNGYRMLQTAVMVSVQLGKADTMQRVRVNFHICTRAMDAINRWGLVAVHLQDQPDDDLPNVWWRSTAEQFKQIRTEELGSLPETLHVFSPQGQLFEFHIGCTVVDYAYRVHSRLADQCRRFTVNGEAVEPATVLHHLDLVELQYDPYTSGPTRVWLNAARTPRARNAISKFLRHHRQDVYLGRQKLDKELRQLQEHYGFHIPQYRVEEALSVSVRKMGFTSVNDLLGDIAASKVQPLSVLRKPFEQEIIRQVEIPAELTVRPHLVRVMQCCRPRLGEEIVGLPEKRGEVITRLKIHTSECGNIVGNAQAAANVVGLKWRMRPALQEVTRITMRAQDDHGLLGDAVQQIYEMVDSVKLHKSEAAARYGEAQLSFVVETENRDVLEGLTDALRRLPNREIVEVRHMNLSLTEREEFGHSIAGSPAVIPYTRAPVYEEGRFFGRRTELERIMDLLRSGEDVAWVLGHKRVGKTSLLRHLKSAKLDRREFFTVQYDFQMLSDLSAEAICFELANAVYDALQDNPQSAREVGAPLRELFQREPINRLIRYLRNAQDHADIGKIVLLLDEFSRTMDTHHQLLKSGQIMPQGGVPQSELPIDPQFFINWRGMIQKEDLDVCFVVVVQQQTFDNMREWIEKGQEDPSWHLMELGEQIELKPLSAKDAHELIEHPMRNFLDLSPEVVEQIYHLTGGGPFLIHAFCSKLMTHMSQRDSKQVTPGDVQHVVMEFMSPNESVFAHLLDLTRNVASTIADRLALMLDEPIQADLTRAHLVNVKQDDLKAALPDVPAKPFQNMLNAMHESDILIKEGADSWRFASLLFQQWLALNQGDR